MASKRSIVISAVLAGAAVAATAATLSTVTAASAAAPAHRTFSVRAYQVTDNNLDLGAKGFGVGDEELGTSRLVRDGKQLGYSVISCTAIRVDRTADQICEFVLQFGSSQIDARGTVRDGQNGPGTFTLPILGGTGKYQGAGGQLTVTATDGPYVPLTVSLTGRS